MNWEEARDRIRASVKVGTDVNTPASTYRYVEAVDALANSTRYGYHSERCFVVRIGRSVQIRIPWSMLKECFGQLNSPNGYDGSFFRSRFPLQARDHGCHVHVVGQIFVAAGIARLEDNRYTVKPNG
jgi:hypothetical protein